MRGGVVVGMKGKGVERRWKEGRGVLLQKEREGQPNTTKIMLY